MSMKALANAARIGAANVEFPLGELEHLPIADSAADVVITNCVINLVPDNEQGADRDLGARPGHPKFRRRRPRRSPQALGTLSRLR
jgi:hypothetical protein